MSGIVNSQKVFTDRLQVTIAKQLNDPGVTVWVTEEVQSYEHKWQKFKVFITPPPPPQLKDLKDGRTIAKIQNL